MPRKGLLVIGAVLVAIAVPAGAAAAYSLLDFQSAADAVTAVDPTIDPPPNDPSRDFAVGGFQGVDNNNVGFSAHSDPLGLDPQGKLSETIPFGLLATPTTYQGRFNVTCLVVIGNQAALGLVPTDAGSNDQLNQRVLAVRDSGLPGGMLDEYGFADLPANTCAEALGFAGLPITHGNILVNDALP